MGRVFSEVNIDNTCDFLFTSVSNKKETKEEIFKNMKKIYLLETKEYIPVSKDFE